MTVIGIIFLLIGLLALAGGALQRYRSGRITKTPFARTGDVVSQGAAVANPKGAISAEGRVVSPQLVTAPVTQTECLFYEYKVMARWKSGDQRKSKLLQEGKVAAPFSLDDGSGPVSIEAGSGGDFDLKRTFHQTKGKGIVDAFKGGGIHFGDHGFTVGTGQIVDRVRIPDSARYEVTERCLMPADHLYALGKVTEHNAIGSPSWASLMLQPKRRDELLAGTTKFANRLLAGGGGVSALGTLLLVVGVIIQVVQG
jgi:E3 Ubiquitin ligase